MSATGNRTTVILIRHGETEWNVIGRIQGYGDSALTALGAEQGRRAAERLREINISAVYASTSSRARDTAEIIAAPHNLPVQQIADLRERCYGNYEGLTLDEIKDRDPEGLAAWLSHPNRESLAPPGGETQPEMSARVMAALQTIVAQHPGETIVIATHGGPVKSVVAAVLGLPIEHWDRAWVTNGSFTVVVGAPDDLRIACFNDTSHLDSCFGLPRTIEG
jgi:broad specificity phosphatase PhoE